jgi:O-antigen ligase
MWLLRSDVPRPVAWPPPGDQEDIAALLQYAKRRDPIGHRLHGLFAMLHLFSLPLATAVSSGTFGLLVGFAAWRIAWSTWRCYTPLVRAPVLWAVAAWVGWTALSLTWSSHPGRGAEDLWTMRMAILPLALWPVMEFAPWLVGAALLGVVGQNAAQLLQYLGWVDLRPQDGVVGRMGGLIHPIQTGAWCVAAMCWHLAAVLSRGGRLRVLSLVGLALAGLGLVATQSRGPWLAAAIILPLALVIIGGRRPRARVPAVALAVLGIVSVVAAWPFVDDVVTSRVRVAADEYRHARDDHVYWSDVGLRIGLWRWAWELYEQAPVIGIGAGGYREGIIELPSFRRAMERRPEDARKKMDRVHAHSVPLHALATTGTVGGVIVAALLLLAAVGAWRDRPDHPYVDGTLFVLLGWIVGGLFDCYTLNGHLLGLRMLAVALPLPRRPAVRPLDSS